jgi:ATP/maltotriose-dependent transcriptional regulator MalT
LLERAAELSMLVDRLEAVEHSSRGHVLLVGGEAGVGKTTLVRRFCEGLGRSARVLWGACDPLFTPSPLGPLLAVAEGTVDHHVGAILRKLGVRTRAQASAEAVRLGLTRQDA